METFTALEQMKIHTMFVIGKRDMEVDAVSVSVHGKGNLGDEPREDVLQAPTQPGVPGPNGTGCYFTHILFTFHFQESELVRGVTLYAEFQPITEISLP